MARFGAVVRSDDHLDCVERAAIVAAQPHMSMSAEPMKLTVRKVDDKWEAAWETKEA